jgi:hypothetical protein
MKIRPVEAKFHADGQADMTKLIFAFAILGTRLIKTATLQPSEGFTSLKFRDVEKIFIVAPCILIYVEFTHQQMPFY